MKPSAKNFSKPQLTTFAIISFVYFVTAVIALYFLNPEYSLIRSIVGNYGLGGYEFLIASTFFSLGLGSLALLISLRREIAQSVRSRIGLVFLGIWGVGMVMAGVFPANDGGSTVPHMTIVLLAGVFPFEVQATPETVFSFVHIFVILGSLFSLSLAAILLSQHFKHEEKWCSIYRYSLILTLVMIAASILLVLAIILIHTEFWFTFSLTINAFAGLLWLFVIVIRLQFIVIKSVSKT